MPFSELWTSSTTQKATRDCQDRTQASKGQKRARRVSKGAFPTLPQESLASVLKRMDNKRVLWKSTESYFGLGKKKSILNPFCYCARSWKSFLATKFSDRKVWDLIGTSVLWDDFLLCKCKLSKVNVWSVWYLKILFSLDIWNCLWGKVALCTILNV